MTRRLLLAGLAAALLGAGEPAMAQWPAGQGNYWAKISFFRHQTTEQYRSSGEKRPFLNSNAKSVSNAFFLDANVGVTDRIDIWAQVPYFDLSFNDDAGDRTSTGIGDIRVSTRFNLVQLRGGSLPISVRYTVKVPVVDFEIDAEVIPLGEGQWDHELWLEGGLSLWPLPAYTVVWLGYRWREINTETTRDHGDELTFLAELGATGLVGRLGAKVVVDGTFGSNGSIQGIPVSSDEREILYVAPTLLYDFSTSTALEVAARIPLKGRNFPAGAPFQIGVFHRGSLFN